MKEEEKDRENERKFAKQQKPGLHRCPSAPLPPVQVMLIFLLEREGME